MSKEKDSPSSDEDLDLLADDGTLELQDIEETNDLEVDLESQKINAKLQVKKRMDDYLERKWFRDNGWDDDDDLFNDDFFTGEWTENRHH